jgi:hypothetical protein
MTKTVKASAKITFNKKTTDQIAETVAAMAGAVTANKSKEQSAIELGRIIDSKSGADVPIFPLLNVNSNAKWAKFKEEHGDRFSHAEWLRGMAFAAMLKSAFADSPAEFKHEVGTIKRNCMYWTKTKKGKEAIARAKKAKLADPEGKATAKPTAKTETKKVDALTENKQLFALLITSFNTLADAQGIAGLPAKPTREEAYELVAEAQRMMHAG